MDTTQAHRREHAFGMVEAIVAAIIVLIIGAAISSTFISTMRTQQKSTLSERRLSAAEGLFERLKVDATWAGPSGANCSTMGNGVNRTRCSENWLAARYANDPVLVQNVGEQSITYEAELEIYGIDDGVDGRGNDDEDGQRPDYFEATVRVRPQGSTQQWSTLTGNIDPPGRISSGAISINICTVERQWDERVPIASCEDRRPKEILLGYPAGGASAAYSGALSDSHAVYDWEAALNRAPDSQGQIGWNMVTYTVAPASNATIELRRADGGSAQAPGFTPPAGCSSAGASVVRCVTVASRPMIRIASLTPGRYEVEMTRTPAGYEPWPLHSIPSGDTAIVEAGRTSRVLQVLKPVNRSGFEVHLWNCDHTLQASFSGGPCEVGPRRTITGWIAPAASARASWSFNGTDLFGGGAAVASGTDPTIRFDDFVPGLYSPRIVTPSQSSIELRSGVGPQGPFDMKWMWMDPVRDGLGGDVPGTRATNYTYNWCDYNRRVAFLASLSPSLGPSGGESSPYQVATAWATGTRADGTTYTYATAWETRYITYYSAEGCERAGAGGGGPPPGAGSGGA